MRHCRGCGVLFKPSNWRQLRCKRDCSVKRPGRKDPRVEKNRIVRFVGVDGEGVTREDGSHDYVLLTVGDKSLTNRDGSQLQWDHIFSHLYNTFLLDPKAAYVGYYLGYDFAQWVRTLSKSRGEALFTKNGINRRKRTASGKNPIPFPVYVGEFSWEIDIMASKRFALRPGTGKPPGESTNPFEWMYICDVGAFFQQSFENTLKEWRKTDPSIVSDAELKVISAGKRARSSAVLSDEMIAYNLLECELLARIMPKLNEGFRAREIHLNKKQWFGPGQAAQAWMRNICAPKAQEIKDSVPDFARNAGRLTYYGGWFEVFKHGIIPGEAWEYDINSAYPSAIAELPCLLHGNWISRKPVCDVTELPSIDPNETLRILRGEACGSDPYMAALPHRHAKGRVLRPRETAGWYWEHEVRMAMRAGILDSFRVDETVEYERCYCSCPFLFIRELYEDRLKVGKNTPQGKSAKLVYNSSYGKMAQSVGNPVFACAIYASLITSRCRTKILEAIATHPKGTRDVLMVATDGIYFRSRHPTLDIDPARLGAWDETPKQNMCLFMPGLYWDDAAREQVRNLAAEDQIFKFKSRGVPAKDLAKHILKIDELFKRWKPGNEWPTAELSINFSMVSPKQALERNKWDTCGTVSTTEIRLINSDPARKRAAARFEDGVIVTDPHQRSDELESTPYRRFFGDDLETQSEDDAAITPEGDAMKHVREMLGI